MKEKGFTLLELILATGFTALFIGLVLESGEKTNFLIKTQNEKSQLRQNLRGAIEAMSINIRQTGQVVSSNFQAVELVNGDDGEPDSLTIRYNKFQRPIGVCTKINRAYPTPRVHIFRQNAITDYDGTTEPAPNFTCKNYSSDMNLRLVITDERTANNNQPIPMYIFDTLNNVGEFFMMTNYNTLNSNPFSGARRTYFETTKAWENNYPQDYSTIYYLAAYKYELIEENPAETDPDKKTFILKSTDLATNTEQKIAFGITDFQATIDYTDDAGDIVTEEEIPTGLSWTKIQSVNVKLKGVAFERGKKVIDTSTSSFAIRNEAS